MTGLLTGSIREQRIDGQPAVLAAAKAKGWTFRIAIIRVQSATYRFVFATTKPNSAYESAVAETINSFRTLSFQQAQSYKPLTIDIVTANAGDSPKKMAERMEGTKRKELLFQILNDIDETARLKRGQKVKLIRSSN